MVKWFSRDRRLRVSLASLLGASLLAACGGFGPGGEEEITVGAVTFAENQIVAEMYALALEDAGLEVQRHFNFQNREALHPEMENGGVDLAPEYLASLLTFLEPGAQPGSDPASNLESLEPLLEDKSLRLLSPAPANDTNALVVDSDTAEELDLDAVSDLAGHASELVFGGPPECPERPFCLAGLEEVYGLRFASFRELDAGGPLTTAALGSGEIDVALMFSTSGIIADRGWVVLKDDRGLQAAENITPLVRTDKLTDEMTRRLNSISASLTTRTMTQLNARVEVDDEDLSEVARSFLEDQGHL